MAFFFITGVMGSGKSYLGTELCLDCLKQGGTVHTNLPLKMDYFEDLDLDERIVRLPGDPRKMVYEDPKDLGDDGKPKLKSDYLVMGTEGAENVVVIDEAALEFDSDTQMDKGERERNKPIFKLVALCRHAGLDLYFISQSSDNVHAKLRRMAEQRIKCLKTERLPVVGWLLASLPWYGTFLRIYFQGADKTPIAKTWHKWRQDVGDAYDTHGMRVGLDFKQGAERKKGTEITQAKGKAFAFGVLALILVMLAFSFMKGSKAYADIRSNMSDEKPPTTIAPGSPQYQSTLPSRSTTRRNEWAEWDLADEYTYNCVIRTWREVRVYTPVGTLFVGGSYQGERIMKYTYFADYHYFQTTSGRWVVARQRTMDERLAHIQPKEKTKSITDTLFPNE